MPTQPPRGVRKISELITQKGRSLILSEEDASKLSWADIPDSTLKINPKTGIMSVKLEGESDWVPAGVKNDGTICIVKDTKIVEETFVVKTTDDGAGNFSYTNSENHERHAAMKGDMYVFELESGTYMMHRNSIEVFIDDTLRRSEASSNLEEMGAGRLFALHKSDIAVGTEITAKYAKVVRIGNPYPRIFIGDNTPVDAEIGDLHIDTDYSLEEWKKHKDDDGRLNWSILKNTPTTLAGYGITDSFATVQHRHRYDEIDAVPESLPAKGGRADSADKLTHARKITIRGDMVGKCDFDGTADANIEVTVGKKTFRKMITDITGTDDVLGYMRRTTNKVRVMTGTCVPNPGTTLPIPAGFERHQCNFAAYPIVYSANCSLNVDPNIGVIKAATNITTIGYTVVAVSGGGES